MTHNLNFRLLASFAIVIIVIFGSVFFFTYRTTRNEISQVGDRLETMQDRRVQSELSRYYQLIEVLGRRPALRRPVGQSLRPPHYPDRQ